MSSAALSWKQTKTFTLASIKSRYRNTIAGFIWVICGPLIIYGVQGYVFSTVLKVEYNNYLLFLMSGLLPWIFFQQSVSMTTTLIFNQGRLLKSFPIHPLASLVAAILDNLLNFVITFGLILMFLFIFVPSISVQNLTFLIPALVSLLIATVAASWFLSVLQVFFHDTKFIADFAMQILFFLTPIVYPAHMVPENFRFIVESNPIGFLLAPFQAMSQTHTSVEMLSFIGKSFFVSVSLLILASIFWKSRKNSLYFKL